MQENAVFSVLCAVDCNEHVEKKGNLSLESKYGLDRLVAACACATQARAYGYNEVKEILERGDDVDFMPSADGGPTGPDTTSPARHKTPAEGTSTPTKPPPKQRAPWTLN